MITTTIVIPFFNEEKNLKILLDELKHALNETPKSISAEVLFVNDGSSDNGQIFIEDQIQTLENFNLINLSKQSGQTGAFKAAFKRCETDYIIRMDSDLQDSPNDLNIFFDKILKEEPDLIMGIRTLRQHSIVLRLSSFLYDLLIRIFCDSPLYTNSGSFVAFKTNYVKNLPWNKNDHRYLPLIVMQRGGKKVTEVKVNHRERKYGQTSYPKLIKIIFGPLEVIKFIIKLKIGKYNF